jgi:gluconokinase
MAAGVALNDADREPWLAAVAAALSPGGVVVACSALRRGYRDRLRMAAPSLRLIYLCGSADLLAQRVAGREHAFMSPSLLQSQLQTLEPPGVDEHPIVADIARVPDEIVRLAIGAFNQLA